MNKVRTVSDTKQNFYTHHTRPINSIYRRVVEELMVEMHLLSVNVNFSYDPIYGLGVASSYDRFMSSYKPEADRISIFEALCRAVETDPQQYHNDGGTLLELAQKISLDQLLNWNTTLVSYDGAQPLYDVLNAIASQERKFKYSRLFAIGLYTLIEKISPATAQDHKKLNEVLQSLGEGLHLPIDKLQKDLELYQGNLEKMEQAKRVLQDALEADRKKRLKRALEKTKGTENSENAQEA
ncbi:photosystem II biogenesis protein Psp29 [Spirulina subsalsa FACHB-351]|uniref:Protein Thf1 n=1 Tax=Spirulina subsalsa FACHB-351 TaxID=234711 RepID=A0ABT3LA01_9CYAN|nr:photosystem II biogenesis protein Psp29 [Spirulina subsalsa]MCW6038332.1 photosystem II biogenesis protein Psp29 [Spirulina subsalsa FACHB-351]